MSIDAVPGIAERYGVTSIPAVLVINRAGDEIDGVTGVPSRIRLGALFRRARSSVVEAC